MKFPFERDIIVYEYKNLVLVGLVGLIPERISVSIPRVLSDYSGTEISPAQKQPGRDFIEVFMTNPIRELTFSQCNLFETGIVGYSFDKKNLVRTMEEMVQAISFTPDSERTRKSAVIWAQEFEIDKKTYAQCETIARILKNPLEVCFGAVRYMNFLMQYMGIDELNAKKETEKKFNISLTK